MNKQANILWLGMKQLMQIEAQEQESRLKDDHGTSTPLNTLLESKSKDLEIAHP